MGLSPPSITSDHSLKGVPRLMLVVGPLRVCVQPSVGVRHDLCPHLDQDALHVHACILLGGFWRGGGGGGGGGFHVRAVAIKIVSAICRGLCG